MIDGCGLSNILMMLLGQEHLTQFPRHSYDIAFGKDADASMLYCLYSTSGQEANDSHLRYQY